MLEAVGVAPTDEEIYRALLLGPRCTVAQLASVVGIDESDVRRSVERLESLGLVSRVDGLPDLWVPARPDVAVDVLAASRRVELDRAQMEARVLLAEMRTAEQHRPENLVEVIVGQQMIAGRFAQLLSDTTRGLRGSIVLRTPLLRASRSRRCASCSAPGSPYGASTRRTRSSVLARSSPHTALPTPERSRGSIRTYP